MMDLWMAFFRDLDGHLLALMSKVPHSAAPVTGEGHSRSIRSSRIDSLGAASA